MFLKLHAENPNPRNVKMIIDCLENDGVIIFPTDTIYAIGCSINSTKALDRIARIKGIKKETKAVRWPDGKSLYKNYSDAWKKVHWNKPSCTIKENHGGTNIHPKLPRCLTPRELAALQSFPDDFIFKGSKKWQLVQIGNAVPPLMGKAIGLAILKNIEMGEND